jgi:hypothetical protein
MLAMENPGALAGAAGAEEIPSRNLSPTASTSPPQDAAPLRLIITALPLRGEGPQQWRVQAEDGELLLARSRSTLCDGARALLALGADPEQLVTMRRAGTDIDCFNPIKLRIAARYTAHEPNDRSVSFRRWRPGPGGECGGGGAKPASADARATYPAESNDAA